MKTWDDVRPPQRRPEPPQPRAETFMDRWLAGEDDELEKPVEKPQRARRLS